MSTLLSTYEIVTHSRLRLFALFLLRLGVVVGYGVIGVGVVYDVARHFRRPPRISSRNKRTARAGARCPRACRGRSELVGFLLPFECHGRERLAGLLVGGEVEDALRREGLDFLHGQKQQ